MTKSITALRDAEGYLVNPEDWDESVGQALAAEEGVTLDEASWPVIRFMRAYWSDHRVAPDVRHVMTHLAQDQGLDRKAAKELVFRVFPYGYVKQACKVAGMQRPRVWSTG